jgi:hypothetical protein
MNLKKPLNPLILSGKPPACPTRDLNRHQTALAVAFLNDLCGLSLATLAVKSFAPNPKFAACLEVEARAYGRRPRRPRTPSGKA